MTFHNINFDPDVSPDPHSAEAVWPVTSPVKSRANPQGLSAHVRRLQRQNQGISRWLVFALLGGTIVALAMVQFAIH
jgi:hypothetical protein